MALMWGAESPRFQSSGSRYPGVPPNRPPRAWVSSATMSHAVHAPGVTLIVTSSKDAKTGPMWGSAIAAELIYRLCMRRFISVDCSPEISSAFPAPLTPCSAPGFRTSTISEALALAAILRAFRLLEEVAMKKQPSSKRYQTAVKWMVPSAFSVPRLAM
jgi:hypothetical protein